MRELPCSFTVFIYGGIGDFVRLKNKFESQGESIQDSCRTSNDVRC